MTEVKLRKILKKYTDNEDFNTAKNYVKSYGNQIPGFNIKEEIEKIDNLSKKPIMIEENTNENIEEED